MQDYFKHKSRRQGENTQQFMNIHYLRLSTFTNWPQDAAVGSVLLAKDGFFYTGRADRVKCFSCDVIIGGWQHGDSPLEKHRRARANCAFVNNENHGNVPMHEVLAEIDTSRESAAFQDTVNALLCRQNTAHTNTSPAPIPVPTTRVDSPGRASDLSISSPSDTNTTTYPYHIKRRSSSGTQRNNPERRTASHQPTRINLVEEAIDSTIDWSSLLFEANRFDTFVDWPSNNPIDPAELSAAGFYYTRISDRVQCVFCYGVLRNWEAGDLAFNEHQRYFPNCPFVLGNATENVTITDRSQRTTGEAATRPKHSEYILLMDRLESFSMWPTQIQQTPALLAEAGFYYTGHADNVKCHYCDGGLRNWDVGEDPWIEHARWFPLCGFVKQTKGSLFIRMIQEGVQSTPPREADHNRFGEQSAESVSHEIKRESPTGDAYSDDDFTKEDDEKATEDQSQATKSTVDSLKQEIRSLRAQLRQGEDLRMCRICLERDVSVVFLPCGHMVACDTCASQLRECAVCRARIKGTVKAYLT